MKLCLAANPRASMLVAFLLLYAACPSQSLQGSKRADPCMQEHTNYEPEMVTELTEESSIDACQQRCRGAAGCGFFSWRWSTGMCHLHPKNAKKIQTSEAITAGAADCSMEGCNCYACGETTPTTKWGPAVCPPRRDTCSSRTGDSKYSCYTGAAAACNCSTRVTELTKRDSCTAFEGIPAWDGRTCCDKECGQYCGARDCAKGFGGAAACCVGSIPHNDICSKTNMAPCTLTNKPRGEGEYTYLGCWDVSQRHAVVEREDERTNSVDSCFQFCSQDPKAKGSLWFGVSDGDQCWCASAYEGKEVLDKRCDKPCYSDGMASINDKTNEFTFGADRDRDTLEVRKTEGMGHYEMCGGFRVSNVYAIYDCLKNPAPTAIKMAYATLSGKTCGDGSHANVEGRHERVASVDECKKACWFVKYHGSEKCHGFTYYTSKQMCVFTEDVLSGDIDGNDDATCYFKKV